MEWSSELNYSGAFNVAASEGQIESIKYLIKCGYNFPYDGMVNAASHGHLNIMRSLKPYCGDNICFSDALCCASYYSQLDSMKLLKEWSSELNYVRALRNSIFNNQKESSDLLNIWINESK